MAINNSKTVAVSAYQGGRRRYRRIVFISLMAVLGTALIVLIFILMYKSSLSNYPSEADQATAKKVISDITSIPSSDLARVGLGSSQNNIVKITNGKTLKDDSGKPRILYIGAEYCPYCALERWAMVVALSQFGTFSGLSLTKSSASDIFANTPTLSFHGSSFSSNYVDFEPVEEYGNTPQANGGYNLIQSLTVEQQSIVNLYDAPPYMPSSGSIPFVDFANQYVFSGATASPSIIQGMDWNQVAVLLKSPASDSSKGVLGSANLITAAVCLVTNDQPQQVCSSQVIKSAEEKIGK